MAVTENRKNLPQVKPAPMLTGAGLIGAGGLIALAGLAVSGFHLLSAFRRWVEEMEVPPSQQVKIKLAQARAAAMAGAGAWQNGTATADRPASVA
jgi:hypothetical protein